MTTKVLYQCQRCGRTLEAREAKKLAGPKCPEGGTCELKEPYYFE